MKVEIVSATRMTEDEFWDKSALGLSLSAFSHDERIVTRISYQNRRGLPVVYNESIVAPDPHDILLFVHDDVWLHDFYFIDELIAGLNQFDVVGLVGNQVREPYQLAWCTKGNSQLESNHAFLSGTLGHSRLPLAKPVTHFGTAPVACELLDGLFLAAHKTVLRRHGVLFDPRFDFHFYDLDFCRSARQRNLTLGTCRISATHQSEAGAYGSDGWQTNLGAYSQKWGA